MRRSAEIRPLSSTVTVDQTTLRHLQRRRGRPRRVHGPQRIEGDPHCLIEGMTIGGYAIGSDQGYIYVRAEYPLAIKRLEYAIDEAASAGCWARTFSAPDFSFDIDLKLGAGAFVCGEETALIASIEGRRGDAEAQAAVSRAAAASTTAHAHQQRRDLGQRARDYPQRLGVVLQASARRRARAPRSSRWRARSRTPA